MAAIKTSKPIQYLPDNKSMTFQMVAEYYGVPYDTIRSIYDRNKYLLQGKGVRVLTGSSLSEFNSKYMTGRRKPNRLFLVDARGLKAIGEILAKPRDGQVGRPMYKVGSVGTPACITNPTKPLNKKKAKKERVKPVETKIEPMVFDPPQQEKRELVSYQDWLSSMEDVTPATLVSVLQSFRDEFIGRLDAALNELCVSRDMMEYTANNVKQLTKTYEYRIPTNAESRYTDLVLDLNRHYGFKDTSPGNMKNLYSLFNECFSTWVGCTIPPSKSNNKKRFFLDRYGIDIIEDFVNLVMRGYVIRNTNGKFVDIRGNKHNTVEFQRTLQEFNHSCAYCGTVTEKLVAEHFKPRTATNSTDVIFNIVPACAACNKSKGTRPAPEWYPQQSFYSKRRWEKITTHINTYFIDLSSLQALEK